MTDQPDPTVPEPSTEVTVLPREPLELRRLSLFDIEKLAQSAARSHYYKDTPISAAAAVKIVWGQELGIPPMAALSGIHMVKGSPGLHYSMIGALLKRHGYRVDVVEWDTEHCVLDWYEPNPDHTLWLQYNDNAAVKLDQAPPRHVQVGQSSWSMEEAKKAGVVRPDTPWITYPKTMMYARALSTGARIYAAEIFSGAIYTDDELREANFGVEASADEIVAEVEVPDTPVVTASPPQPTEVLASPAQRGSLWLRAKNRGIGRASFEQMIKLTFGVTSLDRLPARLVGNAQNAIDNLPPDLPPAGGSGQPTSQGAAGQAGGGTSERPPPAPIAGQTTLQEQIAGQVGEAKEIGDDVCSAVGCMFAPAEDGLCFEHYEERKRIGSIAFELEQDELRAQA